MSSEPRATDDRHEIYIARRGAFARAIEACEQLVRDYDKQGRYPEAAEAVRTAIVRIKSIEARGGTASEKAEKMQRDYCEACGYTDSHDPNCPRPKDEPSVPSAARLPHDYPALCRSLAAWLIGESKGEHRGLKRGETADRLLEMAALLSAPSAARFASLRKVPRDPRLALPAYEEGWNDALHEAEKLVPSAGGAKAVPCPLCGCGSLGMPCAPSSEREKAALHACEGLDTADLIGNKRGWLAEIVHDASRVENELNRALRACCAGNTDENEPVRCQSYEASEQAQPCPRGRCVMAEEDAEISSRSATGGTR